MQKVPEVKTELLLPNTEPTFEACHRKESKEENFQTELKIHVKEEGCNQMLLKSEAPNLDCPASYEGDSLKLELLHEELDLKAEILNAHEAQVVDKPAKSKVLQCGSKSTFQGEFESKFLQKSNFRREISAEENFYKCYLCDYASVKKCRLERHMTTHTGEKPFKCSVCDFASAEKSNLKQHMKKHTGINPFKCNVCDYASTENYMLERHMKTHTGGKLLKCNVCSFASIYKSSLEQHMKIHTPDKPFECNLCGYVSIQKDKLRKHIRTHTGEKYFKCIVCGCASISKSSLKRHMKGHTGE